MDNNKFLYKGKYFEDEKSFFDYIKSFRKTVVTKKDLEFEIERFKENIWINVEMSFPEITNEIIEKLLSDIFLEFIKRMYEEMYIEEKKLRDDIKDKS